MYYEYVQEMGRQYGMRKQAAYSDGDYTQSTTASLLQPLSVMAAGPVGLTTIAPTLVASHNPASMSAEDKRLMGGLADKFKGSGGRFVDKGNIKEYLLGMNEHAGRTGKFMHRMLGIHKGMSAEDAALVGEKILGKVGPNYMPAGHFIYMPGMGDLKPGGMFGPHLKPGILAHEIGHSMNMKGNPNGFMQKLYNKSKIGSQLAVSGSMLGGMVLDDASLGYIGGVGSALSAPMLAEELRASAKGYRLMRSLGAGRGKALGAFVGVPSYFMGSTVAPMLPWAIRKVDRAMHSE